MTVHRDLRLLPACAADPAEQDAEPDPAGGGLDHGTAPERQAVIDYLMGVAIDHVMAEAFGQYGGRGTREQRARLYREARAQLMDKATTFEGLDEGVDRARAVGRGEVAW